MAGSSNWEIYDQLLAMVPAGLQVEDCLLGLHWILVRSSRATGLALTPKEGQARLPLAGRIRGMPLQELASYVKSWQPWEAALGLAAINAALNAPSQVEAWWGRPLVNQPQANAFTSYRDEVAGQKVAVIGRFPDLEPLANICQLTVLERRPGPGDLPDSAGEYILPEQDYVFITATTLSNKTLPRLLELSHQARVVLVGPSTPLAPLLFDHGLHALAGTVVMEPDKLYRAVAEGATMQIFEQGAWMVRLTRQ